MSLRLGLVRDGMEMDRSHLKLLPASKFENNATICEIYLKYNAALYRYLEQRLEEKEDIDDIAQEVYLRLIKYKNLDETKICLTLLRTIASNLLKDRARRQSVRATKAHISIDDVNIESSMASPEETLKSKEAIDAFKTVYKSLNKDCQRVYKFHRFKGYTYEKIAKKMGISKSMVQKHISHALFKLGKKFESLA